MEINKINQNLSFKSKSVVKNTAKNTVKNADKAKNINLGKTLLGLAVIGSAVLSIAETMQDDSKDKDKNNKTEEKADIIESNFIENNTEESEPIIEAQENTQIPEETENNIEVSFNKGIVYREDTKEKFDGTLSYNLPSGKHAVLEYENGILLKSTVSNPEGDIIMEKLYNYATPDGSLSDISIRKNGRVFEYSKHSNKGFKYENTEGPYDEREKKEVITEDDGTIIFITNTDGKNKAMVYSPDGIVEEYNVLNGKYENGNNRRLASHPNITRYPKDENGNIVIIYGDVNNPYSKEVIFADGKKEKTEYSSLGRKITTYAKNSTTILKQEFIKNEKNTEEKGNSSIDEDDDEFDEYDIDSSYGADDEEFDELYGRPGDENSYDAYMRERYYKMNPFKRLIRWLWG